MICVITLIGLLLVMFNLIILIKMIKKVEKRLNCLEQIFKETFHLYDERLASLNDNIDDIMIWTKCRWRKRQ